jgi:hypothetical protein
MIEFLKAFKILVIFVDPWVLIPAICAGILVFIVSSIASKREYIQEHKIRDPLDWIDDEFFL